MKIVKIKNECFTTKPKAKRGSKTKKCPNLKIESAISFLCIFDGFRTPTIRRLGRFPKTICFYPLLTFDPHFYAPSSEKSIRDLFMKKIKVPCNVTIDPSVNLLTSILKCFSTLSVPHRTIFHYCGQGCHEPSPDDGRLYFFSENRQCYKPVKLKSIIESCANPLLFIFDCNNAGCLKSHIVNYKSAYALFSCSSEEKLQVGVDVPLDLFSCCIFQHVETAFWWHFQQHRSSVNQKEKLADNIINLLSIFLESILEAIIYDMQSPEIYDFFSADPALAYIFRGYALAQRIMLSYHIHPDIIPEMTPMFSHELWGVWDISVDIMLKFSPQVAIDKIFKLFIDSFKLYPLRSFLPLFSTFITNDSTHYHCSNKIFKFADSVDWALEAIGQTTLPAIIADLENPSTYAMCFLAKYIAYSKKTPFEPETPLFFKLSEEIETISSGLLCIILSMNIVCHQSFIKLMQECMDYSCDCAPFSCILIGRLIEKMQSNSPSCNLPPYEYVFEPLLEEDRADIRASTIFALGFSKNRAAYESIVCFSEDEEAIVRIQVMFALLQFCKQNADQEIIEELQKFEDDEDDDVQAIYRLISPAIFRLKMDGKPLVNSISNDDVYIQNPLIEHLTISVKSLDFEKRYADNVFDIPIPIPTPIPIPSFR